jgi:hypothetical protein
VDRPTLRAGPRDEPGAVAAAFGETVRTLLALPVPAVAVRVGADEEGLPGLALSAADVLLVPEEHAPRLQAAGLPVSGTWSANGLAAQLARVLGELRQNYTLHGALGRRALAQHRYVRWARLPRAFL